DAGLAHGLRGVREGTGDMEHRIDLGERRRERLPVIEPEGLIFETVLAGDGFEPRLVAPGEKRAHAQCPCGPRDELPRIAGRAVDHELAAHFPSVAPPPDNRSTIAPFGGPRP